MSDALYFQPGVALKGGQYLLKSSATPGQWSLTLQAIRADDLLPVILKTPRASASGASLLTPWMRRTFQGLSDIHHPSRARILDFFEQDGRPYLVMQKVQGHSLAEQLKRAPLPEAIALQLIRQIAMGLANIHSQGLVHRDIKPRNILSRQGLGIPTLVDWGLQPPPGPATQGGALRTTPYSAPEQGRLGPGFQPGLDLYSLAATLYTAVTGIAPLAAAERSPQVPNPSPTDPAGLRRPRLLQPQLSQSLEQAILLGMALDPRQRPATVADWLAQWPQSLTDQQPHQPPQPNNGSSPAIAGAAADGRSPQGFSPEASPQPVAPLSPSPFSPLPRPGHAAAAVPPADLRAGLMTQPPPSQVFAPLCPPSGMVQVPPGLGQARPPGKASDSGLGSSPGRLPERLPEPLPRKLEKPSTATSTPMSSARTIAPPARPRPTPPGRPLRRLLSVIILTGALGLGGGMLLRVMFPEAMVSLPGMGRSQSFPEADWPGNADLDDLPEALPRPDPALGQGDTSRREAIAPGGTIDQEETPPLRLPSDRQAEPLESDNLSGSAEANDAELTPGSAEDGAAQFSQPPRRPTADSPSSEEAVPSESQRPIFDSAPPITADDFPPPELSPDPNQAVPPPPPVNNDFEPLPVEPIQ